MEECIVNHLEKDICEDDSVTCRLSTPFYYPTAPLVVEGMYNVDDL